MKYVTTIERRAEARGMELGERSMVQRLLTRRFGELPETLLKTLDGLALNDLEQLGDALLDFTSIDDLTHWLSAHL